MFWNDDEELDQSQASNVVDVIFKIEGKTLPTNYLSAIVKSLSTQFGHWDDIENLSIHLMLGGEEGNGWYRDKNPENVLYLSRRTKLILRVENITLGIVQELSGQVIDVEGHSIKFSYKNNKAIQHSPTLYSQYVISESEDEMEFLENVQRHLQEMGIRCKKILCGKSRELIVDDTLVNTRSLMLNELNKEDSLLLQTKGIGGQQKAGCGVFVPYKSIT